MLIYEKNRYTNREFRMSKNRFVAITLVAFLININVVMASLDNGQANLPSKPHGKLVWADLYSGDVDSSIAFYTATFGWRAEASTTSTHKYHIFYDGEQAVAGLLARENKREKTDKALWIGSIDTDKVTQRVATAAKNQADIIFPPHDVPLYHAKADTCINCNGALVGNRAYCNFMVMGRGILLK
jgi:predicted enzyme related to lactoylglutathione lyase